MEGRNKYISKDIYNIAQLGFCHTWMGMIGFACNTAQAVSKSALACLQLQLFMSGRLDPDVCEPHQFTPPLREPHANVQSINYFYNQMNWYRFHHCKVPKMLNSPFRYTELLEIKQGNSFISSIIETTMTGWILRPSAF
jgi:hypothetical protein